MPFWTAFRRSYADGWRFLFALPLIALATIGFEGLQHIIEWHGGMFRDAAGMRGAADDPTRLVFGAFKVVWLMIIEYWVIRFVVSRSAQRTLASDPTAVRKFAVIFLLSVSLAMATLFLPLLCAGPAKVRMSLFLGVLNLVLFPVGIALEPWIVGAAIGDARAGPWFALKRAWGSIWWGLGLTLATITPAMILHYVLNYAAVGRAPGIAVAILACDAVFVGFLGVVIHTSATMIAARMAAFKGETLEIGPPKP